MTQTICDHTVTRGNVCVDCETQVMAVHDRPCSECKHSEQLHNGRICKKNLMAITKDMLVTYYLVAGPGRYGLCFEENHD